MAAFANLTLADGQATPVNHTFVVGPKMTLADGTMRYIWRDFSVNGGVPIGANRAEFDVKFAKPSASSGFKASTMSMTAALKIVVPTLETLSNTSATGVNPQPQHAFDTTVWHKLWRGGRASTDSVKDAIAYSRNFVLKAAYTDTVYDYSPPSA